MEYPFPLLYPEQHPAEATLDFLTHSMRSHTMLDNEKVKAAIKIIEDYFEWKADAIHQPLTQEEQEFERVANLMQLKNSIFVFGSNLAGRHGAGAAKIAFEKYGAVYGQGEGLQGRSYAIPTKDEKILTLNLATVQMYVGRFKIFASLASTLTFVVTKIGCGLAGFSEEQIRPMFRDAPDNCRLPIGW